MCGICGWVDFERDLGSGDARRVLADMTATMACRGPDDEGTYVDTHAALGHRRLAVIDLPGGHQPMTIAEEGRSDALVPDALAPDALAPDALAPDALALVYSGETYNFRELRERLALAGHRFGSRSDTEVVLHAHGEWGRSDPRAAVRELNGMFAYALWATAPQELLLVRDRLGIKPLYYYPTAHGVLFGSEPKAVLANPVAERVLDADGLRRALGFVADPRNAVFRGLREVPPGHVVRVSREGISQQRYWGLADTDHADDVPATVRHVRELLEDTTRRQLISDVPLCTLLSGGLDSSALTALAACQSGDPVRSFAVDFTGYTENFTADDVRGTPDAPYVHDVVAHVGTDHTDITLSTEQLMDPHVRATTLHARDLPSGIGDMDTSLYLLFRSIRGRSTVALSGESADEVFGGYRDFHDPDTVAADTFPWLAGRMMERNRADPGLWDSRLVADLDLPGYYEDQYRTALAEVPALAGPAAADPHERRMRQICYLYLTRFLPLLLDRKDRMSMAVGLEVRVPFCDHRLVEYVFGAPWAHKTFDGREKSLLRAATADLLPDSVVQRVKSPYPSTQDAGYERALRRQLAALVEPDSAVAPLLDPGAVRQRLATPVEVHSGMAARMRLEQALALDAWLRDYHVTIDV